MRFSLSLLLATFLFPSLFGQSAWKKLDKSEINNFRRGEREVTPTAYEAFTLDISSFKKELKKVKDRDFSKTRNKKDLIEIPFPDGKMVEFDVWNAPLMAPGISARYPNIKSYKALSDDGKHVMRFIVTNGGFNGNVYQSYYIKDQEDPGPYWKTCGTDDSQYHSNAEVKTTEENISRSVGSIPVITYRMAMACTGEYAQIVGGTVEAVLQQYNLAIMRLSQLYELNASVNFMLIDQTDELIFLDASTDPYINTNRGTSLRDDYGNIIEIGLIDQNQEVFNNLLPFNTYDIGHIFTRFCVDVGGVASLASVCGGDKARGVSCVGSSNITSFASGTMAHEVGHQFSASHSWNWCTSDPDNLAFSQRSAGWAIEPGSGSTIMSYSGACGLNNTGIDDDYFSAGSLEQIHTFTRGDIAGCGVLSTEQNNEPEIEWDYEDGFFIPKITPFILHASATDIDGDEMQYGWDQFDRGPGVPLGSAQGSSPLFVSVYPDDESTRYFPRLNWVRANLDRDIEILPNYGRDMTFRFVVKDQNPMGSAVVWQELKFEVADNAGPFFVTKPNFNPDPVTIGQELEVTWDVSNTDIAPVNCQFVNILLSTDDGRTFDRVLAGNTENDGSEIIRIPNAPSFEGRIKVEAVGNIFYDMGNNSFLINEPTEPTYTYELSENRFDVCSPAEVNIDIQSFTFVGYDEVVDFEILGSLPDGVVANLSETTIQPDGSTSLAFDISEASITGNYVVTLQSISGSDTIQQPIFLNITSSSFDDLAMSYPVNGSSGVEEFPTFAWNPAVNAESYTFELATSPAFGDSTIDFADNIIGSTYETDFTLDKSTLYYWRISAKNKCKEGEMIRLNTFGTVALSCKNIETLDDPVNISANGSGDYTIEQEVFVEGQGQVSAIAVKEITGNHQRFSNLVFSVESPTGTSVTLVSNKCGSTSGNFDFGFDDASPFPINCPYNAVYQPEEPLAAFAGEESNGIWLLKVNDQTVGGGGALDAFKLEVCINQTLDPPFIVNNIELGVHPGSYGTIPDINLKVDDNNNTAEELTFTVVDVPENGYIARWEEELVVGDQFTQEDIDANRIRYYSEDETATTDQFTFTCIDGEGGWIDITPFDIAIDESFVSDVKEIVGDIDIEINPNPVSETSFVSINNTFGKEFNFSILNLNGQVFSQNKYKGDQTIEVNVKDFTPGIYFINIESAGQVNHEKMVIVK